MMFFKKCFKFMRRKFDVKLRILRNKMINLRIIFTDKSNIFKIKIR